MTLYIALRFRVCFMWCFFSFLRFFFFTVFDERLARPLQFQVSTRRLFQQPAGHEGRWFFVFVDLSI